jgi:hypothetical protein
MEANDTSKVPGHGGVIDRATLYLSRQGEKWVVVIESARISGALHRELSAEPETHLRHRSQRQIICKCHWGR